MDRQHFLEEIKRLRATGKSIRTIALELNIHRSRVERALRALRPLHPDESAPALEYARPGNFLEKSDFVGRHRELAILTAALDASISGQSGIVMLVGEPGIGKTRTAEELTSVARQCGAHVLWGRCAEERGAPGYWPWAQALRSYMLEQEPDALRLQMGGAARDIAQLVPDVQERLPDLTPSAVVEDPEQARFRLFDAVGSFLKRASHQQPLLLILDNLHWADTASLRLLEFIAAELVTARVLVLGTYRDVEVSRGHPLFRTLGELTRQHLYQRVLLRGLSRDEVGEVTKAVGGVALPQELVATVHQQTEGNPLFVREVVRLLAEEGLLAPERLSDLEGWDFRLPEGIREVIGRRLDRLSRECNEVLTIASVVGRQFSIELLERMVQQPQEKLLEVLEESVAAQIIDEMPSPVGHFKFSHALIQHTLATELSTIRKVRMHSRIAHALEELYGDNAPDHASELSYHFAEAESVAGTGKLVTYSRLAGEQALAAYAYEEALAHFQRALAAKEGRSPDAGVSIYQDPATESSIDTEMADLFFGLGCAQSATYQIDEALASLGCAFEYYASTGDLERVVALAGHHYRGSLTQMMTELRRRALSLLPTESLHAGRLLAFHGLSFGTVADYDGANQAFSQALAIARREGDTALEVRSMANAAQVHAFHLQWLECLDNSLQAITVSEQLSDLTSTIRAHGCAANALLQFGKLAEAQQHRDAMLALAEHHQDQVGLTRAWFLAHLLSRLVGDFQAARDFSDRILAVDPRHTLVLASRVQIEHEAGEFRQGNYYLDQLLEGRHLSQPGTLKAVLPALAIPLAAQITGVGVQLDVAETAAHAILSLPTATPDRVQWARIGLALLAVQRGDVASAAEQYSHLESSPGWLTRAGTVTIARVLGLLAQTMGKSDLAAAHFEETLAFCRRAGYRPELAWTCYSLADALLGSATGRNEMAGRLPKAISLLDEAIAISEELHMRPLTERANTLSGKLQAQQIKSSRYPAGLTERQVQVLLLIAKGRTNREIAEKLVLSERTVQGHIAGIYTKIGARNRVDATSFALSHLAQVSQP